MVMFEDTAQIYVADDVVLLRASPGTAVGAEPHQPRRYTSDQPSGQHFVLEVNNPKDMQYHCLNQQCL